MVTGDGEAYVVTVTSLSPMDTYVRLSFVFDKEAITESFEGQRSKASPRCSIQDAQWRRVILGRPTGYRNLYDFLSIWNTH